jgi:nucleotide-binding universal stress UspA family protein
MIKTILVHLSGAERDKSVLCTALHVARLFDGHLHCLHVLPDYGAMISQWVDTEPGTGLVIAETLARLEIETKERAEGAKRIFAEFCKAEDIARSNKPGEQIVTASLHETTGNPADVLIAEARFHDLVVVAGGGGDDPLTRDELGALVISAGRPVLLAPHNPRKGGIKTAAIAWKNCPEAARAITAAMPLISKAHHVSVLSAAEDEGQIMECLDCYEHVATQLHWHGLRAEGRYVVPGGRTIPDAILETAHEADADILVMGAYGHSRLRELVFGGFTRRVLAGAALPVLLFH